ncbi:hypothetical protein C8J56DRAFT_934633 [Mycena floridula]|nr:hypothetical protein C8J56DRAFT_934633 [Mycena floridula]
MSEPESSATEPASTSLPELKPENAFKVYKPSSYMPPPPPPPDDYFTPTAADLKAAQSELSARTQALVNAPLQLRSVSEAAAKAKRDRFPNTTIRIRFTDRTQLEKIFPSTVKIRSVYAFVRSSLREDVKPIKFILYQPPRRDLKVSDDKVRNLTLSELQLSPASVLLLRFEDETLNGADVPAPLEASIMAQAMDLPPPPSQSESTAPAAKATLGSTINSMMEEKKIPKWLKGFGKK